MSFIIFYEMDINNLRVDLTGVDSVICFSMNSAYSKFCGLKTVQTFCAKQAEALIDIADILNFRLAFKLNSI